jgi:hypothetical protein
MKFHPRGQILISTLVLALLLVNGAPGGHPLPPHRSSSGRRQANMVMLRFQDAIDGGRWSEALSYCSARVRGAAAKWPSVEAFFSETMPIEQVLSQDFGCWNCSEKFYGLVINYYSKNGNYDPSLQWFWGIEAVGSGWVIDYPPVKMEEYIARKRSSIQERSARLATIQNDLQSQSKQISTRITALTNRFVVGGPMPFRLDAKNNGDTAVRYSDGAEYYGLSVANANSEAVPYGDPPAQIADRGLKLIKANSEIVVAERIDINQYQAIKKPGKYFVKWNSLRTGQPVPHEETGRFGETMALSFSGYITSTNPVSSNVIEIEVQP